jgi:hypothetical protein
MPVYIVKIKFVAEVEYFVADDGADYEDADKIEADIWVMDQATEPQHADCWPLCSTGRLRVALTAQNAVKQG